VHTLLQQMAQLPVTRNVQQAQAALAMCEPRIVAQIRAKGVEAQQARSLAAQALQVALQAARDPVGQWILSPHLEAASEVRWTGVVGGALRTVQVDRVFRGGTAPRHEGDEAWWIIDYKTAYEGKVESENPLPELRAQFAPQIEAYAKVLRNLHGTGALVFAGLYYPRMAKFDWWQL
jgi:ATP-dependent exoDNAse (exonuclease V) beta subunit